MLRVERLTKSFRSGDSIFRALDGLSLDVPTGAFVTIIGSNGAGKSTLLRAILGLVEPDSGLSLIHI